MYWFEANIVFHFDLLLNSGINPPSAILYFQYKINLALSGTLTLPGSLTKIFPCESFLNIFSQLPGNIRLRINFWAVCYLFASSALLLRLSVFTLPAIVSSMNGIGQGRGANLAYGAQTDSNLARCLKAFS